MEEVQQPTLETAPLKQELSDEQKVLQEFNATLNLFINKVTNYPGAKSALQRVLTSLTVSPLNKDEFHFSYPEEKELFELGTRVNSAKFFLMVSGLENKGKIQWVNSNGPVEGPKLENEEQVSTQ